jgi:uncharacterized protein (DUF4415 family)
MPMVEYDLNNLPEVSREEWERVDKVTDEEINLSDMPGITDFSGFVRAADIKTVKSSKRVEIILDADVIAWVGKNYQSRINAILREVMKLTQITA